MPQNADNNIRDFSAFPHDEEADRKHSSHQGGYADGDWDVDILCLLAAEKVYCGMAKHAVGVKNFVYGNTGRKRNKRKSYRGNN